VNRSFTQRTRPAEMSVYVDAMALLCSVVGAVFACFAFGPAHPGPLGSGQQPLLQQDAVPAANGDTLGTGRHAVRSVLERARLCRDLALRVFQISVIPGTLCALIELVLRLLGVPVPGCLYVVSGDLRFQCTGARFASPLGDDGGGTGLTYIVGWETGLINAFGGAVAACVLGVLALGCREVFVRPNRFRLVQILICLPAACLSAGLSISAVVGAIYVP